MAHLALALAIYAVTLWIALGLVVPAAPKCPSPPFRGEREAREGEVGSLGRGSGIPHLTPTLSARLGPLGGGEGETGGPVWRRAAEAMIALVALTIVAGGFVAGLHAGLVYNTFPLMDGGLAPPEYAQLQPFVRNWFENAAAAQFDHRVLAMTTAAAVLALWLAGSRAALPGRVRLALHGLLAIAALQFALGVSILLLVVPIPLAAAHQGGAVLLLTAAIVLRHSLRSDRKRGESEPA